MKLIICFVCIFLSAVSGKPRDLADEVLVELEELWAVVEGAILTAHDELSLALTEFDLNSIAVSNTGAIRIQQEKGAVDSQVAAIKTLGEAAGVDVTSCTDLREEILNRLPEEYINTLNAAIRNIDIEAARAVQNARFIVDATINRIDTLNGSIAQCAGNILCLTPLVTEIELNKIRLPQNIRTEVQAVEGLLTSLRSSVSQASDTNVVEYISASYAVVRDILLCVEDLIDS